jgi:hypothetical protein
MLTIKVLGPGCPNCQRVEAHVREALAMLNPQPEYEIIKVADPFEISQYVLSTPGLVINDKVVAAARIPSPAEIKGWLVEVMQTT